MKLPLSWLKDYVDIDVSVKELEAKLFSCGFEVEETVYFGKKIDKMEQNEGVLWVMESGKVLDNEKESEAVL